MHGKQAPPFVTSSNEAIVAQYKSAHGMHSDPVYARAHPDCPGPQGATWDTKSHEVCKDMFFLVYIY